MISEGSCTLDEWNKKSSFDWAGENDIFSALLFWQEGCDGTWQERKCYMVRDRQFYRDFFVMWIVLVLQNVITLSVNLADNMMLGAYSETALAGVAAVNQIQFVYQQLLISFGEAAVILGTQYYGKRQMGPVRELARGAMYCGVALSAVLFLAASVIPRQLMLIFTTDEEIILQGIAYLRVIRFTYLVFAVAQILLYTLRIVGTVKISLYLSVTALLLNCFWNYALIYGRFGFPSYGVAGAAAATLISRLVELGILIGYLALREDKLRLTWRLYLLPLRDARRRTAVAADQAPASSAGPEQTKDAPTVRWAPVSLLMADYIRMMLPLMVVNALWGLNNAAQNAILGHMTARAIAANSVASTLFLLVKSTAQGSAATASFFTGKTIGEGDYDRLKLYARTWQVLFVIIGILSGMILFFLRIPILSLYRLEVPTRAMADTFLIILSVIIVTMSYQMPVNAGIIKGGGDIRYAVTLDLVSIWCIVIPISWAAAFVFHASPIAVVWCLNADQIFKAVPAFIKCNFGHWAKKLTR